MTPCTLTVRAFAFIYGEDGFSQVVKRTATGIKHAQFPILPRIGETIRFPLHFEGPQGFTVKNVTHEMMDQHVGRYEIHLGSAMVDEDVFTKGIERWKALGFDVTVEDKSDAV